MTAQRVLASATTDDITINGGEKRWRVTVWALQPFDVAKVYEIVSPIERTAAQEGIRRFCEEAEDAARSRQ